MEFSIVGAAMLQCWRQVVIFLPGAKYVWCFMKTPLPPNLTDLRLEASCSGSFDLKLVLSLRRLSGGYILLENQKGRVTCFLYE